MAKPNKCPKCNKDTFSKRLCKDCTPKKKGRGSVGRCIRGLIRRTTDIVYIENVRKDRKKCYQNNKEKLIEKSKKYREELTKFKNNICEVCSELLDYRSKSSLCREHSHKEYFRLYRKYGNHKKTSKEYRRRHWIKK